MGYNAAPLEKLIEEFSKFPGIGRKGATRMAYQVLSMSDADAAALAGAIQNAHTKLHRCRVCQNYTEAPGNTTACIMSCTASSAPWTASAWSSSASRSCWPAWATAQ